MGALISLLRSEYSGSRSKFGLKKSRSTTGGEPRARSADGSVSESGARERSREVVFPESFEVLPQPRDLTYVGLPHEQQRKFRCRFCGKGYRWKSTMRRHETVECGGKPPAFQCPECPYKARQRGNLTVHYKRHHLKMPFDEVSQGSPEEQRGQSEDEEEERRKVFGCEVCGRRYRRVISLQRHKRLECGKEAQFECIICHSKFKHKHSLLRHYRVHLSFANPDNKLEPEVHQHPGD
ncbi:Similar to lola: Longitudinals lacking protein [Cotesia congregata]|uniref:Isoform G (Drosophila melanogaster) n=2 Tax=Cotesia congregata TaxID=51543 RepID=A0A8J2MS32_COTCN|nr:Similar to lola: Longitudinals lacking protein [Cotesia congregata]